MMDGPMGHANTAADHMMDGPMVILILQLTI
jgi:hypothetical protein